MLQFIGGGFQILGGGLPFSSYTAHSMDQWVLIFSLDPNPIDPRRIGVTGVMMAASALNPPPPAPNVLTTN